MNKHKKLHPFKANMSLRKDNVDKKQLRIDVKKATTEYLKTKTIQYQNDSPNGKVQSVGIRELGSYCDSAEFYYLEESLDDNLLN